MTPPNKLLDKRDHLLSILKEMGAAAVAFSGGVDSTVVAKAASLALHDKAIAITADSASVPRREIEDAHILAAQIGISHRVVKTNEFANPDYVRNDGSRCYYCKSELYSTIEDHLPRIEQEVGLSFTVCSGANVDDQGDYRPGLTAAGEHSVRHPLQEAGFSKAEVRELAKLWELPAWDKPASPCLSSRLAPGVEATPERTAKVEAVEDYLRAQGLRDCRARLHEKDLLRLEVPATEIAALAESTFREPLLSFLDQLGFRYITLDLQGLRSGSLNSLVDLNIKKLYTDPSQL